MFLSFSLLKSLTRLTTNHHPNFRLGFSMKSTNHNLGYPHDELESPRFSRLLSHIMNHYEPLTVHCSPWYPQYRVPRAIESKQPQIEEDHISMQLRWQLGLASWNGTADSSQGRLSIGFWLLQKDSCPMDWLKAIICNNMMSFW